jgi:hypothetical protein
VKTRTDRNMSSVDRASEEDYLASIFLSNSNYLNEIVDNTSTYGHQARLKPSLQHWTVRES